MACVIPKENADLTEQELHDYIVTHIAKHKTPRYITFVDCFPMNAAGKILKYKMREQAIEQLNLQAADSVITA
jgi:fatty-acyl-CoA synthase